MNELEKIQSIQISNLSELISDIVGVPVVISEINIHEKTRSPRISFESQPLIQHTGILSNFFERFVISSFNANLIDEGRLYWVNLSFSFTYKSGGSNGHTFQNIFYNFETQKWTTTD